jgi:hypothetical protein
VRAKSCNACNLQQVEVERKKSGNDWHCNSAHAGLTSVLTPLDTPGLTSVLTPLDTPGLTSVLNTCASSGGVDFVPCTNSLLAHSLTYSLVTDVTHTPLYLH